MNAKGEDSRELFLRKPTFPSNIVTPKKPPTAYLQFIKAQFEKMDLSGHKVTEFTK